MAPDWNSRHRPSERLPLLGVMWRGQLRAPWNPSVPYCSNVWGVSGRPSSWHLWYRQTSLSDRINMNTIYICIIHTNTNSCIINLNAELQKYWINIYPMYVWLLYVCPVWLHIITTLWFWSRLVLDQSLICVSKVTSRPLYDFFNMVLFYGEKRSMFLSLWWTVSA